MSEPLHYALRDGVAVLTMDDGKVNALGPAMAAALDTALDRAEEEASAVVLVGRPGKFSAGFDLKTLMAGLEPARALVFAGAELWLRMYAFPKPIVAACTGHALAGGAIHLMTCDLRIGARGPFKIGLNEVSINIPLPTLARAFAEDRLARNRLFEATALATVYTPDDAAAVGFLDRVTDPEAVTDEAFEAARALGRLPAKPFRHTKSGLRDATVARIRATLDEDLVALTGG